MTRQNRRKNDVERVRSELGKEYRQRMAAIKRAAKRGTYADAQAAAGHAVACRSMLVQIVNPKSAYYR